MATAILALNAGSSSIKFAVFPAGKEKNRDDAEPQSSARGQVSGIGGKPRFSATDGAGAKTEEDWPAGDHEALLGRLLAWVDSHLGEATLGAVGHRIVHGGPDHVRPARIDDALIQALDKLTALAPLHQPHCLAPIRAITTARPGLPQVACFDTAFHATMPVVAQRFALPREYEAQGLRRYGFHGLSYEYIARRLGALAPDLATGRVVVAHLGNGASLCAMQGGRSVDTTMGLTALDGLVMGTRCGTLDPGMVLYLVQQKGMSGAQIEDLLYHRSGLLGVSGIGGDMRDLLKSEEEHAREAVELFVFRLAREAGGLVASLGGLDGLVFTGGIGEHAAPIRRAACVKMAWLGVELDDRANACGSDVISTPGSRVLVRVIPTDEEATIARHTLETTERASLSSGGAV